MALDVAGHDLDPLSINGVGGRCRGFDVPGVEQELAPEVAEQAPDIEFVAEGFLPADLHGAQDGLDHFQVREGVRMDAPDLQGIVADDGKKVFFFVNAVIHPRQEVHVEVDGVVFAGDSADRGAGVEDAVVDEGGIARAENV